jgi:predicted dinucleotide-binding enzyme
MKIGILGTGIVGNTLGNKLIQLDHEVKMGSRSANNEKAAAWVDSNGIKASQGTFEDASKHGEIVFNCTSGGGAIEALKMAGEKNLAGKILVDVTNPLDFSKGMPPTLSIINNDSLGETIQRTFPNSKVVKALNTISCRIMTDPASLPGDSDLFICGNDPEAKAKVTDILKNWFGWKSVIDLGDITNSRGTEQYLALWVRLMGILKTPDFNIHIVKK